MLVDDDAVDVDWIMKKTVYRKILHTIISYRYEITHMIPLQHQWFIFINYQSHDWLLVPVQNPKSKKSQKSSLKCKSDN